MSLPTTQATRRFRKGHRTGEGPVLAVVRPGTLLEQWEGAGRPLVAAGRIVIMQAANTGLTGGSTPDGADYDREIVLVNTTAHHRCAGDCPEASKVVCLPGATLDKLEQTLAPLGRSPIRSNRLVVHWRFGAGRHLQQLGRRAGTPRRRRTPNWPCTPA